MSKFVGMGSFYHTDIHGLVKVVCRATHHSTGEAMIAYVKVGAGGCASEIFLMPEDEFITTFLS